MKFLSLGSSESPPESSGFFFFLPPPFSIAPPLVDSRGGTCGHWPKPPRHTLAPRHTPRATWGHEKAPSPVLRIFPPLPAPGVPFSSESLTYSTFIFKHIPGRACVQRRLDASYLKRQRESRCTESQLVLNSRSRCLCSRPERSWPPTSPRGSEGALRLRAWGWRSVEVCLFLVPFQLVCMLQVSGKFSFGVPV